MDSDQKTLLITVGLVVVILYIARPKNSILNSRKPSKTDPPSALSDKDNANNKNGKIAITAMRNALNDNLAQKEVDKLNNLFLSKYRLKVFFGKNKILVAKDSSGKIVAREY